MTTGFRKILVWAAIILLFPLTSFAAETSIAYVDVQRLLTESDAAKHIQSQVQKRREKFLGELSKQEQDLNNERKEIEEGAALPKEELAAKRKKFEEDFQEARKSAQKRKKDLDVALNKAVGRLRDEISKVVKSVAAEKGYTLVISQQAVLMGDESANISGEVMAKLNKTVSKIPLEMDSN